MRLTEQEWILMCLAAGAVILVGLAFAAFWPFIYPNPVAKHRRPRGYRGSPARGTDREPGGRLTLIQGRRRIPPPPASPKRQGRHRWETVGEGTQPLTQRDVDTLRDQEQPAQPIYPPI